MSMSTFDGWETRLYGDAMGSPPGGELMHFRTKGSKNGVRRYQTESGEWTPLGLKERKAREGWGESKAERRAAKLKRKSEKREARRARVAAAKEAAIKKKASKDVKNLSDSELQQRINRIKKENEYKELTKNPVLKTGEKLVNYYLDYKQKRLDRDLKVADSIVKQQEARTKQYQAKTARINARTDRWDTIMRGKKHMAAKKALIEAKAENTIGGALRKNANKILRKQGDRFVNDMGEHSRLISGGRKTKEFAKRTAKTGKDLAKAAYEGAGEEYIKLKYRQKKKKRSVIEDLKG